MKAAFLADRGIVKVAGEDARGFLNNLVSGNVLLVRPGLAVYAALLTPQGKIVVDGLVSEIPAGAGGGFLIDCPRALVPQFIAKLGLYKLRAKIEIADLSDDLGVLALWDGLNAPDMDLAYADPRTDRLGWRVLLPENLTDKALIFLEAEKRSARDYESHRIALGVPRGGLDFAYGDAFPHEANMDRLHGVDFDKGCYIGQEVVSRMEHRGTARTRILRFISDGPSPEPGIAIVAGDKTIGTSGGFIEGHGLGLVRIDRLAQALGEGAQLSAGNIAMRVHPEDLTWLPQGGDAA